jgi:arylformamidase
MIYDISPPVTPRLAVWPGDVPLSRDVSSDIAEGDAVTLSSFRATAHLGAHADAPGHFAAGGCAIDEQPLDLYMGPCRLIRVKAAPRERVTSQRLPDRIDTPRVLIDTGAVPDPNQFNENFAGLAPDAIDHLHECGVHLVGVDAPSVDLFDDETLAAHQRCARRGIAILEGLYLAHVPEGVYELIALPLRLVGFDASPVRAVLRTR